MVKRKRIGIPFLYSEGWVAGTYYILNLIEALKSLDDSLKPEICILAWGESDFNVIKKMDYRYLRFFPFSIPYNFLERLINKITRTFVGKNIIEKKYTNKQLEIIFPYQGNKTIEKIKNKIYWIPDFQERYFPKFFSEKELQNRKTYNDTVASSSNNLVFSSENAASDFKKFYPDS